MQLLHDMLIKFLQAYKITVVYSDGSKSVLRKKYEEFVDLQVSLRIVNFLISSVESSFLLDWPV